MNQYKQAIELAEKLNRFQFQIYKKPEVEPECNGWMIRTRQKELGYDDRTYESAIVCNQSGLLDVSFFCCVQLEGGMDDENISDAMFTTTKHIFKHYSHMMDNESLTDKLEECLKYAAPSPQRVFDFRLEDKVFQINYNKKDNSIIVEFFALDFERSFKENKTDEEYKQATQLGRNNTFLKTDEIKMSDLFAQGWRLAENFAFEYYLRTPENINEIDFQLVIDKACTCYTARYWINHAAQKEGWVVEATIDQDYADEYGDRASLDALVDMAKFMSNILFSGATFELENFMLGAYFEDNAPSRIDYGGCWTFDVKFEEETIEYIRDLWTKNKVVQFDANFRESKKTKSQGIRYEKPRTLTLIASKDLAIDFNEETKIS